MGEVREECPDLIIQLSDITLFCSFYTRRESIFLVSLEGPGKLPIVRLLPQVVKVAVRQLSALSGNLHRETGRDAVGALTIYQGESLEIPW